MNKRLVGRYEDYTSIPFILGSVMYEVLLNAVYF